MSVYVSVLIFAPCIPANKNKITNFTICSIRIGPSEKNPPPRFTLIQHHAVCVPVLRFCGSHRNTHKQATLSNRVATCEHTDTMHSRELLARPNTFLLHTKSRVDAEVGVVDGAVLLPVEAVPRGEPIPVRTRVELPLEVVYRAELELSADERSVEPCDGRRNNLCER